MTAPGSPATDLVVLAHGVGTRTDLPLPLGLTLYSAGMAVAISFVALGALWRRPALVDQSGGRTLPGAAQTLADAPAVRRGLQAVTLVLALLVVAVGLFGPVDTPENIAPWAFFITFWVGLVPASLLLGPVWRVVNPLRLLHRLLVAVSGPAPAAHRVDRLGYWPAAVGLTVFVWVELVYPERSRPSTAALFIVVYSVAQLIASLWFGERWFERGDAFEAYSSLLGRLSPLGRRADGRLALRNPLRNAAALPAAPGLAAVVVVLVGSTAFDGLSRTRFWTEGPGAADDAASGTLGLAAMIGITAALYLLGTVGNGLASGQSAARQPGAYAHSVVPIAAGYSVAHYFSLLLIDGQLTWILASNPFGRDGVDLFGTYGNSVDYLVIGTATIAYVQVASIVVGHVLGVVLAHDRALEGDRHVSLVGQLPLAVVMIAFTVGGLGLLFGGG